MSEPQPPGTTQETKTEDKADLPPPEWRSDGGTHDSYPDDLAELNEPRRRRTGLLILIAVVLALLGATITGLALLPQLSPLLGRLLHTGEMNRAGPEAGSAATPSLVQRVATLEQRVETVETQLARTRADLEGRLAATAGTLDMVQRQLASLGLNAKTAGDVGARLESLEQAVKTLQATPPAVTRMAPAPAPGTASGATLAKVQAAEAEARAKATAQVQATEHSIAALRHQIDQIAQSVAAEKAERLALAKQLTAEVAGARSNTHEVGLVLAVQRLGQAARDSNSFAGALAAVTALKPGPAFQAPLELLGRHARAGVPGVAELRIAFDALAANIVRAAEAPKSGTWWRRVLRRLAALVVVRRVGDVPGSTPDAIVARAEQRIDAGDLPGAVKELDALQGPAAEAARGWLKGARARLAVEGALADLETAAAAGIEMPPSIPRSTLPAGQAAPAAPAAPVVPAAPAAK